MVLIMKIVCVIRQRVRFPIRRNKGKLDSMMLSNTITYKQIPAPPRVGLFEICPSINESDRENRQSHTHDAASNEITARKTIMTFHRMEKQIKIDTKFKSDSWN